MKLFQLFLILIIFQSCSFDNKSGIWKSENSISFKEKEKFSDFKTLSNITQTFNKTVLIDKNFNFKKIERESNSIWTDIFFNDENNTPNFEFNSLDQLNQKTKKLSKNKLSNYLLSDSDYIISSDEKGDIIIFSKEENRVVTKFNFYKKKYRKFKKDLNLIVENEIIFVSDNLGYLYAYNFFDNKVLWAKDYKIPFRSNLKISGLKLIGANQNNSLYFFNKLTGEILQIIPTEETLIKNNFKNNLALQDKSLFFLNSYGSLYAFDVETNRVNWFINLNRSINLNPSNLFLSNQITVNKEKIIVPTNDYIYVVDKNNGSIDFKKNFKTNIKPLVVDDYIFVVTNNNLLVAWSLKNGKIIYSYNINEKIKNYLELKKNKSKKLNYKNLLFLNDKIFIFLENSYILTFNIRGNLEAIDKLPTKIKSSPIIIEKSLLYLDKKNRLSIIN